MRLLDGAGANWLYRMITTMPLEEKLALFWHESLRHWLCQAQPGQRFA